MGRASSDDGHETGGWRRYAAVVVRLRWAVVAGWLATAVTAVLWLPPLGAGGEDLEGFGLDNPAVATELRSFELFGFPLLSRVALVQHDPGGLSTFAQAESVLRGVALNQGAYDTSILGALPVPNTLGAFPSSQQSGTTVVTYLFQDPRTGFAEQQDVALEFAREQLDDPDDAYVGVTGSVPARAAQGRLISDTLPTLELVTIAAVLAIVAVTFRSLLAPVVTLLAAATAIAVTLGVAGSVARLVGVAVPADLEPLIVALLLGVVTDYAIFFLSGLRHRVRSGAGRLDAARLATADFAPIVAVAGVTVAFGTATLVVAQSALFRGFGPGMAITVLIGMLVAVTLVPALLAILGRWALWPGEAGRPHPHPDRQPRPSRLTQAITRRGPAIGVAVACVLGLAVAAVPLARLDLGVAFVQSLPEDDPVQVAAAAAAEGFAPGILSPTEILLEGEGLGAQPEALAELGRRLDAEPGVAGVVGPRDLPVTGELGILVSQSGDAARYLVVFDTDPLAATAIENLERLEDRLPALLETVGLEAAIGIAGDTALAQGIVDGTTDDLLRISVAALAANLLMLVVFLRALVAPLYLLASSVLALCAALGTTVWVFQGLLDQDGLTFYVPFAAAVLLVSLGSDYNIFGVGHIWQLATHRPLREAIALAVPQSTRAITSAGFALAASFGLLALVPLRPFRELAFAMAFGILLDVLVVRALLVPALLTAVGPVSGWPSGRLRHLARTATARVHRHGPAA